MEIIFLPCQIEKKLQSYYQRALDNATELYILSAYLTHWENDYPLTIHCKTFRLIVGKDFGITRKQACRDVMKWLPNNRRAQFLVAEYIDGFHPKVMFWRENDGQCFAVVGSSNLSQAAFASNHEVNSFSKIDEATFAQSRKWIKQIESRSVGVSEVWLEKYTEAKQSKRESKATEKNIDVQAFKLALPWPEDEMRVNQTLRNRRKQIQVFQNKRTELEILFRDAAEHKGTWSTKNNDTFYNKLNSLWVFNESGCRFQGAGWERQGKGSNFRKFSKSLVRVIDTADFARDDIVAEEIDEMAKNKVATRGALFSEMLCQFFPDEFHVLDKPVKKWFKSTGFTPPAKATEGSKYIDFARKLRTALELASEHPAKNLAELDVIIWLSTQPQ
jgi:HKD family nuclease